MWRNYLIVGLRALLRSRTYAFINIFGLALGLAACILLLIYVRYETAYDRWLPDSDRIFQVQSIGVPDEGESPVPQQGTHGVIAESMAREFPEIEAIARVEGFNPVFLREGQASFGEMHLTEENFFRIVPLPFIRGNPETALRGMDSLVLSRSEAVNRFGSIDVIGETLVAVRRGAQTNLRVTGVFEDIPRNSHMNFRMIGRISEVEKEQCGWSCINGFVYLKLRPGADAARINARMQQWEQRHIPTRTVGNQVTSEGALFDWRLVNVADVHLSGAEGVLERPGNDRRTLVTFTIVALLILAMASINFVNLATARAGQRAREVALRKVLGARRKQLIAQFLGESLLIAGVAMLAALAIAELSLPWLSAFLGAALEITYFDAGGILLPLLALFLIVGLAGGLYPAFYLSRFQPAAVLKANQSGGESPGTGRLRSLLVVAQFAISIGLIICTIVVYAQTRFAQSTDLGFERDGLIQIANMNRAEVVPMTETLMRELGRVEGVESVAGASITVATGNVTNTEVQVPGRDAPVVIGNYSVSPEFFRTMGTRLVAGRTLSRRHARDRLDLPFDPEADVEGAMRNMVARGLNVVVNRLGAEQLGFAGPHAALGQTVLLDVFPDEIGRLPATIVGVVENSRFRSARDSVEPSFFYDRGAYRALVVRYRSSDPEGVRRALEGAWQRLLPTVPFDGEFADAQLAELYATDAARGRTFAGFALLAVVIACLGLFGLAAFTADRRTREIGIRKVFGARVRDIVRLLAWQFAKPVIVANLIAWPVAWWVMRDWLDNFEVRVDLGPGPFLLAGLLAFVIAIGTISGHAIRVARTNPIHALRYE